MKTLLEMPSSKQKNKYNNHRFRKKKNVRITFYDIRLRVTLLQDFL